MAHDPGEWPRDVVPASLRAPRRTTTISRRSGILGALDDGGPGMRTEAYFRNVDAVLLAARARGIALSVAVYHQAARARITAENARAWSRWVARRYKDEPNLVWSLVPEAKPEFVPVLRELAAG